MLSRLGIQFILSGAERPLPNGGLFYRIVTDHEIKTEKIMINIFCIRTHVKLILLTLMLIICQPIYSKEYLRGNHLLNNCKASLQLSTKFTGKETLKTREKAVWCAGFLVGLYSIKNHNCPPSGSFHHLNKVIVLYLEKHPEILHLSLNDTIKIILNKNYPNDCSFPDKRQ